MQHYTNIESEHYTDLRREHWSRHLSRSRRHESNYSTGQLNKNIVHEDNMSFQSTCKICLKLFW